MEHPAAKPVYYIFEDDAFLLSERSQFKEAYLRDEHRKFTQLKYVTSDDRAAPWVQSVLKLLEERLRSPAAVVEQVRRARVAERPEHVDKDEGYARTLDRGVRRLGEAPAGVPVPIGYGRTSSGWCRTLADDTLWL
ncbi:hypothetical protein CYMTET_5534 [Cymbomonas tetramitiformis]|uniref:Uncharacterized protein n=1 Tax=Cymbomonas tetramitiformis TaxID=36881 RepID=A0AAE0GZ40_9CHLO|nr:hypothetical protein CYMTET_5534 [Cymbomonas tetramitiformis]